MLTDKQPWQPPFHYDPTTGTVYDADRNHVCALMPYVNDKFNEMVAEALTAHFQEKRIDGPNSGLTALEKKVAVFALLPDGWDSYGAKAFAKQTIELGMEMARKLGDEWKAVPCGDGSIEFYRNNEDEMVWVSTSFDEVQPHATGSLQGEKK